ncbi:MAG: hypothetical protein WBR30_08550, partial [Candidatus Sulfotelmatobacter sp.]
MLDRVSGDQVNEQEDETYYQPDYWEGVEDALEEGSEHGSVASFQGPVSSPSLHVVVIEIPCAGGD